MEIRQLEIFCKVADEHGFSLAADKLGLTQPTVSFQIASLEEELGTRLLERGGRTTMLTKSGEVLYRYARRILELSDEAEQAINSLEGLLWGEISLGASTIPGEYILPAMLHRFRDGHPGIRIHMRVGDTGGIIRQVLENEIELGIVGAGGENDKLTFTKFMSDRLTVIAPASNQWIKEETIPLQKMKEIPFIMREEGSGTRSFMEREMKNAGGNPADFKISMILGSTEAIKRAVESGVGISIVSEKAIKNEIELGKIRKMEIEGLSLERDFFIVYRRRKVLSPAAEALLEFLKSENQHGS